MDQSNLIPPCWARWQHRENSYWWGWDDIGHTSPPCGERVFCQSQELKAFCPQKNLFLWTPSKYGGAKHPGLIKLATEAFVLISEAGAGFRVPSCTEQFIQLISAFVTTQGLKTIICIIIYNYRVFPGHYCTLLALGAPGGFPLIGQSTLRRLWLTAKTIKWGGKK